MSSDDISTANARPATATRRTVVGQRARRMRDAQRLSQRGLARIAGVSHRSVNRVEAGRVVLVATLWQLAGALGVSLAELVAEPDDNRSGPTAVRVCAGNAGPAHRKG